MRMGFQPIRTGVSPDSEYIHAGVDQLWKEERKQEGRSRMRLSNHLASQLLET